MGGCECVCTTHIKAMMQDQLHLHVLLPVGGLSPSQQQSAFCVSSVSVVHALLACVSDAYQEAQ